ncbi:MAG: class I SAM-dependent methyltransferase [Sulfuricella sp.]|nr:class I SAM-dependent methyltransferase [Sulfuricella sp.]
MSRTFADHFSTVAGNYASFRPTYPAALFDWLAQLASGKQLAWDCAAGSGQASLDLAARFAAVIATDASLAQIGAAPQHPQISYRVAPAEASGLDDASVDLITVAQALHWFDLEQFYAEARRVLKPGGILAAWSYGVLHLDVPDIDRAAQRFYAETVGPYWPPERRLVEEGYRSLPFPFEELVPPEFAMHAEWSLPQLLGYFASWSATARCIAATGRDPVADIAEELLPLWGDPAFARNVHWPLAMRVGRHGGN